MSTSSLFFISLISFIIAWIVIYYVFRRLRMKKVTSYPFLLVIKTGIGMDIIKDKRKATFVSFLGWSFLAISIGLMVYFYYLIIRLFSVRYITGGASGLSGGIVPLIPGITISFDQLVYFLIAIGIAVIAHELSHALVARAEGIPIKDSGFLLFAFIPAAFVEPDESVMKSSSPKSRLKVYSAGVAANLLLGLLFLAIFVMIAPRLLNGIIITSIVNGSPAALAGLKPGMTIVSVNGTRILTLKHFMSYLVAAGAESKATSAKLLFAVKYHGLIQNVSVFKPKGAAHIGISVQQSFRLSWLVSIITALYLINIGFALINAAPLFIPLPGGVLQSDGGYIFLEVIGKLGKRAMNAGFVFEVFTLLIIISLLSFSPIRLP